jgi:pyrroline-5-carboxylate reductase
MKITFIGGGNMSTAIIGGLRRQGFAADDIRVVEPLEENRKKLAAEFSVHCLAGVDDSVLASDVLVLAVKPQQMRTALAPLAGRLTRQLVLSIAAGLRMADLARWLGGHERVVRAMPNTPALIGAGITGWCANALDAADVRAIETVLNAMGGSVRVADESLIDAVTAVSGSGPAYVFYFIEALRDQGVALGLDAATANRLAIETFRGAALLAAQSDEDVALLRQRVTSKGGTTEAALKAFDAAAVKTGIARGIDAANARGRELGDQLGKDE